MATTKKKTEKSTACSFCGKLRHGEFYQMCDGSLDALLEGFMRLREKLARKYAR